MILKIEDKKLILENPEVLRTGNVNTYVLTVEYDDTYDGRTLVGYFKNGDTKVIQTVANDMLTIPYEVLQETGTLYIGIFSTDTEDETVIDRYCTNFASLKIIEGAYDDEAIEASDLNATLLEQYLTEMKEYFAQAIAEYDENASTQLEAYNTNSVSKIEEFNTNSETITTEFNENYEEKKTEIDTAVSTIEEYTTTNTTIKSEIETLKEETETARDTAVSTVDNREHKHEYSRVYIEDDISSGDTVTTPEYTVGSDNLIVFACGERLIKDEHYSEVGTEGETSTEITLLYNILYSDDFDKYFDFLIKLEDEEE